MKDDRLCPCVFHLPMADNDGRDFEPELLIRILKALDRQFHGHNFTEVTGSWEGQVEQCIAVEVSVPSDQIELLKMMVRTFGRELGQKKMYFKQAPPSAELLDC